MTLTLTSTAAERLQRVLAARNNTTDQYGVRVAAEGGGCSGYKYSLAIADAPRPDDLRFEHADLRVYVDSSSAPLLEGTVIDYIDGLMQGGFKFSNPNAASTCGCGQSFQAGQQCPSAS